MFDGFLGLDAIQMCVDITQSKGPVKLDFGVWQHAFNTGLTREEAQDLDTVIIGDGSKVITIEDILKAFKDFTSDSRIEELYESDGREYNWLGWRRVSKDDIRYKYNKKKSNSLPLEWRASWQS